MSSLADLCAPLAIAMFICASFQGGAAERALAPVVRSWSSKVAAGWARCATCGDRSSSLPRMAATNSGHRPLACWNASVAASISSSNASRS